MEQTLLTDQDNALVYGEDSPAARAYFARFAERRSPTSRRSASSLPRRLHGDPLARAARRVAPRPLPRLAREGDATALLEASIFFDFRPVHGDLDVAALHALAARAGGLHVPPRWRRAPSPSARPAGSCSDPRGRVPGGSQAEGHQLDRVPRPRVRPRGRGAHPNTLGRIRAAFDAGLIAKDTLETLTEAYGFLLRLRLREQLRMIAEGRPPVNVVSIADLSSLERSRLRDTFRAIEDWQERAAYHYRTDMF